MLVGLSFRLLAEGHLPVAPNAIPAGPGRFSVQVEGVVWWLLAAFSLRTAALLGDSIVNRLRKRGERKAHFVVHAISIVAFAAAAISVSSFVFELPVSTVFATSSIVAVVLGFSLQTTLSDLLSGVALNLERPFHVGQWIAVGDGSPGQVVEMNWRATRLLRAGDLIVYPNGVLARSRIVNYDAPTRLHRVTFEIKLDNDESPSRAAEVLRAAALSAEGVQRDPAPQVQVSAFGDWSIDYRVVFWISDYSKENAVISNVLTAIWTHLSWAGLGRPIPHSVVSLERQRPGDEREELGRLLGRMAVFAPLAESERLHLAAELRRLYVPRGTRLIAQGETGRSLFIVREGLFGIRVATDGVEHQVAELRPGDYFGEASLLTGAPRNASVDAVTEASVFELDKDAVASLLAQRSEVAEELARALAEREAARMRVPSALANGAAHSALADAAGRIRAFLLG